MDNPYSDYDIGVLPPGNGNGTHPETDGFGEFNPNESDKAVSRAKNELSAANLESAMRQSESFLAAKAYVEPGDDIYSLFMRTDISAKSQDAYRWLVAAVVSYNKAAAAGFEQEAKAELMMLLAGRVSLDNRRMKLFTDAMIGMHRSNYDEQGFIQKLKNGMSNAFGGGGDSGK